MDSLFSISPPENFDFSDFSNWPNWIRRFERFRVAAGLDKKDQGYQVNSLVYAMGDKADDILSTLGLSTDDAVNYKAVKEAFDKYFICKYNVIYERARFNRRSQEPGESAEAFISAVYKLAEHCQYGPLQDEMIRDRLVVGIRHQGLSEKLQMDSELTLERAVTTIRQHEEIKKQQPIVRDTKVTEQGEANVDLLKFKKKPYRENQSGRTSYGKGQKEFHKGKKTCGRCGKGPPHSLNNCAAREAECRRCRKRGHFAAVCKSGRVGAVLEAEEEDVLFLGAVSTGKKPAKWKKTLKVNGKDLTFKLDTGAEATAISSAAYSEGLHGPLTKADIPLCGPSNEPLQVRGQFKAVIKYKDRTTRQLVYMVEKLATPLLGLPAITDLKLLHVVNSVRELEVDMKNQYPKVFTGLGCLTGEYKIKLKEDAKPCVTVTVTATMCTLAIA